MKYLIQELNKAENELNSKAKNYQKNINSKIKKCQDRLLDKIGSINNLNRKKNNIICYRDLNNYLNAYIILAETGYFSIKSFEEDYFKKISLEEEKELGKLEGIIITDGKNNTFRNYKRIKTKIYVGVNMFIPFLNVRI